MKVDILDEEVFNSLSPSNLEHYLSHARWQKLKTVSNEVAIWQYSENGHKHRVWVPLDQTLSDYAAGMSRAVKTIASVQTRSQLHILEDLETSTVGDTIRVMSFDRFNRASSTLPLHDGLSLIRQAQDMTTAAAASTIEKREVLSQRRPNKVIDYMKELRIAQTERGSFIVKLVSPINPNPDVQLPLNFPEMPIDPEPPFERQVVVNLMRGLDALNRITTDIYRTGRFHLEAFQEAVQEGVSANLCEAVANASDEQAAPRHLEVRVSWSYTIAPPQNNLPSEVVFPTEVMPFIERAAQQFRERNPEEIIFRGYVTALKREKDAQSGVITVAGLVEGKLRNIRIALPSELYTLAIHAHDNQLEVSCQGRLVRQGNFFTLENPMNFHVTQ